MNIKYTINGQSFLSYLREQGYSLSKAKLFYWLMKNKCMTPEEVLNFKRPQKAEDQLLRKRRNSRRFRGYTDEELDMSVEDAKKRGYMQQVKKLYHGKRLGEWSRESGIPKGTLYYRVNNMGMNIKEAVAMGKRQVLKYKGKTVREWLGYKVSYVYDRIARGWSVDDAFTIPKQSDWNKQSFEKRGVRPKFNN